jgi:hypothetical protein
VNTHAPASCRIHLISTPLWFASETKEADILIVCIETERGRGHCQEEGREEQGRLEATQICHPTFGDIFDLALGAEAWCELPRVFSFCSHSVSILCSVAVVDPDVFCLFPLWQSVVVEERGGKRLLIKE